jgi:hypothetical protein
MPTSRIFMHGNSTLNIIGNDLEATLVDANYEGMFSLYQLFGAFADGTAIGEEYFAIQNGSGASYHLLPVPEPSGVVLLFCAVTGRLLSPRRRHISVSRFVRVVRVLETQLA